MSIKEKRKYVQGCLSYLNMRDGICPACWMLACQSVKQRDNVELPQMLSSIGETDVNKAASLGIYITVIYRPLL